MAAQEKNPLFDQFGQRNGRIRRTRRLTATVMTGAERKTFKSELRAALRRQAQGIPQPTQADVLLLWMDWLHRHDRAGARRLMAWAIGTRLTVLAFHGVDAIARGDIERLLIDVTKGRTAAPVPKKGQRPTGSIARGGSGVAAQCVTLTGTMLAFAVRRGIRADNPAHGIKKPPVRKMNRFLSEAEIARLAKSLEAEREGSATPYPSAAIPIMASAAWAASSACTDAIAGRGFPDPWEANPQRLRSSQIP
jgi:hypothetical protein